jgi:predicted small lipoprotein YifL
LGYVFRFRPIALAALIVPLALAGCGRRGPLELPNGAPKTQTPAAEEARQTRILNDQGAPGLIQSPNQYVETTPPEPTQPNVMSTASTPPPPRPINGPPSDRPRTFILDPLL